jgi:hypothetical protein
MDVMLLLQAVFGHPLLQAVHGRHRAAAGSYGASVADRRLLLAHRGLHRLEAVATALLHVSLLVSRFRD